MATGKCHRALRPPDHGGRAGRGLAATHAPSSDRTGCGARVRRALRDRARVLPLSRLLRAGCGEAVARSRTPCERHRGLSALPDVARGVRDRGGPEPDARGGHPDRVLEGRGRRRSARGQRHLRRGTRDGRPTPGLQERGEGDRRTARTRGHLHGQVVDGVRRLLVPPAREPLGCDQRSSADGARRRRLEHIGLLGAG